MFPVKSKKEIGAYFAELVKKRDYKSMRQFGKACLERWNEPVNDGTLQNISDRLSQIKKGEKWIQVRDLPVFCDLLNVTCEELLSAGECIVPSAAFMTVRQFAASHDPAVWEAFVNREDKAFLNHDEFGTNAVEYALEFKNYDLLKYLMAKNYIWFVDLDSKNCIRNFGAGTSIQRRNPSYTDNLGLDLRYPTEYSDFMRRQMICLALEHKDFDMLTTLKAREVPTFYGLVTPGINDAQLDLFRDEKMLALIADSDDTVIDYFSQEFTVPEMHPIQRENTYIFPYIGRLAEILIERNHPCAEAVLKRCAEHNRKFLRHLENCVKQLEAERAKLYEPEWMADTRPSQEELHQICLRELYFTRVGDLVTSWCDLDGAHGITNLISIDSKTDSFRLAPLIEEINGSRRKVLEYDLRK